MAVGRGLQSLIRKKRGARNQRSGIRNQKAVQGDGVFWLDVAEIKPNPEQPRKEFQKAGLATLAASIREHGILEPLVVEKIEAPTRSGLKVDYRLIAGERRLRAAKLVNVRQVPVIIRKARDDRTRLLLSLVENIQREDLNAIERAEAFQKLQKEFGLSQKEIAERVGFSRVAISNTIRLLELDAKIKESVRAGELSEGHGRAILSVAEEERDHLFRHFKENPVSVREAEAAARQLAKARAVPVREASEERARLEDKLRRALGAPVRITRRGKRGSIAVIYSSHEELEAILRKLLGGED